MKNTSRKLSPLSSFWFGMCLPWTAGKAILSNPKLLGLSILPIIFTSVIYILAITHFQNFFHQLILQAFIKLHLNPEGWGAHSIVLLTQVGLIIVSALTFSYAANIVAIPVNDFLAEGAEQKATPPLERVSGGSLLIYARNLRLDLFKSLIALTLNIMAIIISWIPVIQVASLVLTFLIMTFQFISYPQTRRGEGVSEGVFFLFRHFFACLGFGMTLTFLFSVPLVNIIALPCAVVGGTFLFARARGSVLPPS